MLLSTMINSGNRQCQHAAFSTPSYHRQYTSRPIDTGRTTSLTLERDSAKLRTEAMSIEKRIFEKLLNMN